MKISHKKVVFNFAKRRTSPVTKQETVTITEQRKQRFKEPLVSKLLPIESSENSKYEFQNSKSNRTNLTKKQFDSPSRINSQSRKRLVQTEQLRLIIPTLLYIFINQSSVVTLKHYYY